LDTDVPRNSNKRTEFDLFIVFRGHKIRGDTTMRLELSIPEILQI